MPTTEERVAGLRALADHLEANPELDVYSVRVSIVQLAGEAFAKQVHLLGGERVKKVDDEQITVTRTFPGEVRVVVIGTRSEVCTARVVGTETVEIPDPTVIVPTVTVERDVIEWDCAPVLESAS